MLHILFSRFFWRSFSVSILLTGLFLSPSMAAEWESVGKKGFTGSWGGAHIVVDSKNTPYVAHMLGCEGHVQHFVDGVEWYDLPPVPQAAGIDIAIDSADRPYVLLSDGGDGSFWPTVKRFEKSSNSWVTIGNPNFYDEQLTNSHSIAISKADVPYVAFASNSTCGKAIVMKYNGTLWEDVGDKCFSPNYPNSIDLAIDSKGSPYVVFSDIDSDNAAPSKAIVMKFDGSDWVFVGNASGVSVGSAIDTTIAINSHDVPYIGFVDVNDSRKATVMKYNGTSWEYVGSRGFSTGEVMFTAVALDSSDLPHIGFSDRSGAVWKATVMKFKNGTWSYVGGEGLSDGGADMNKMAIRNDVVYVSYGDFSADNNITVKRYGTPPPPTMSSNPSIIMYLLD